LRRWEELRPELDARGIRIVALSSDTVERTAAGMHKHGLRAVMLSDSPSAKYWASMISESLGRGAAPTPAPTPEPEVPATPNPRGFAPGATDMGALCFICNNASHGPYEPVFSRCLTCGKTKRFAYDYGADCYRCAVCKKTYQRKEVTCDKCGQPPQGRIPIRMKTSGGL